MRGVVVTTVCLLSVGAAAGEVAAQQVTARPAAAERVDRFELAWSAPAGCPTEDVLRARVAEAAGTSVNGRALVRAERQPTGKWLARVQVAGAHRQLVGATCDEVAAAAAVIVGLALRQPVESASPRRAQALDREQPAAPDTVTRAREAEIDTGAAAPRRPGRAARWDVGATAGADIGILDGVAPAVRAGVRLVGSRFAARVDGGYARDTSRQAMSSEPVSSHMALASVSLGGCVAAPGPVWVCAGAEGGRLTATAASEVDEASGSGWWLAARAGPSAAWPLGRSLELVVEAEAVVPLVYPHFVVNGQASLPDPSPVAMRSGLGLRLLFP